MGYSGLRNCGDGDDAAGIVYTHVASLIKVLKTSLKEKGNEVNPSGAVNVGLFNEEFILPVAKRLSLFDPDSLSKVLLEAHTKLLAEIKEGQATTPSDWGNRNNKRMHLRAYVRLAKKLEMTLKILEVYPEQWMTAAFKRRMARKKK